MSGAATSGAEKALAAGANGGHSNAVPAGLVAAAAGHWAFQPLAMANAVEGLAAPARTGGRHTIDALLRARMKSAGLGLGLGREADRPTLIRRVALVVTGLPPTPEEIETFVGDRAPGAYGRMVARYLESARYGERWGKHWLDVAGYADSNGYFNADSDRPLAYRYRDYVIRSFNRDLAFDRFVREQVAGDELSGWRPGQVATREVVDALEATHFLRNGQDGSGESDGNPDEVRVDRYYALESSMQIIGSSLLGVTVQCAKCHDHKFEPVTQKDYYALQAVLYPAFHIERWVKPNDRVVQANLPGELEAWEAESRKLDAEAAALKDGFRAWVTTHRVAGRVVFSDAFEGPTGADLPARWSATAPGDDAPAGMPPVRVFGGAADGVSPTASTPASAPAPVAAPVAAPSGPAARVRNGALQVIEGGPSGDRWLCTQERFDWRPAGLGQWIQVTFDLVATRLGNGGSETSAERIGYVIGAHDFNDNGPVPGGNILVDGNPGGATSVHLDYPGADAKSVGTIGGTGYKAGRNYGVRVTRTGTNAFSLEHLVDGAVDGGALTLRAEQLASGAFAFEYCCGRSFVVDNVVVEASDDGSAGWVEKNAAYQKALAERRESMERELKAVAGRRTPKPGRIAWMSDVSAEAPVVRLLKRGNPKTPGEPVDPDVPAFLRSGGKSGLIAWESAARSAESNAAVRATTGRRLAWANWLTEPGSPQAALLARVTVNRIWQHYFGVGLVATPDNFGLSGARPTHPELLDGLAAAFIASGWSQKAVHRLILESEAFRQSSAPRGRGLARDPENRWLWRYPVRRLDAEAIRDSMLSASGRLGTKAGGPYVPTPRSGNGEVVVDEGHPEAFARSVYLQHRRTQVPTFLGTFDAPSIVFNCSRRAETTMPLQSLSLLNSDFAVRRGADLARRVEREAGDDDEARLRRAFLLTAGRGPDSAERRAAQRFLAEQRAAYAGQPGVDARARAWADLCQSLFGFNAFLYLE